MCDVRRAGFAVACSLCLVCRLVLCGDGCRVRFATRCALCGVCCLMRCCVLCVGWCLLMCFWLLCAFWRELLHAVVRGRCQLFVGCCLLCVVWCLMDAV